MQQLAITFWTKQNSNNPLRTIELTTLLRCSIQWTKSKKESMMTKNIG